MRTRSSRLRDFGVALRVGVAAALTAIALCSCSDSTPPAPALVPPARGGAAWTELELQHFRFSTDAPEPRARAMAGELEKYYSALEDTAFRGLESARGNIHVVAFDRENDFRAITGSAAGWFSTGERWNDPEPSTLIAFFGPVTESVRHMFLHEIAHHFITRSMGGVPPFLAEGIAQYYSTLRVEQGSVQIGAPLPLKSLARGALQGMGERIGYSESDCPYRGGLGGASPCKPFVTVVLDYLPSIATLVNANREAFLGFDRPDQRTLDAAVENSLAAWSLAHMLHLGPAEYRAPYAAFVRDVAEGKGPREAWARAFHDVPADRFERDFHAYLSTKSLTVARYPYQPRPQSTIESERVLSNAEVRLLWARLRMSESARFRAQADVTHSYYQEEARKQVEAIAQDLDDAVRSDPTSSEARFWRGLFRARAKEFAHAREDLQVAVTMKPDDSRYLLGLASALFEAEQTKSDEAGRRELDAAVQRLRPRASTAYELDFIARYEKVYGAKEDALRTAQKALQTDRTCRRCSSIYADLLYLHGQLKEAIDAKQRSIDLAHDSEGTHWEEQTLACFRKGAAVGDCLRQVH